MLNHQTADKLRALKLPAMAAEYIRQSETPVMDALTFDERAGMMADAEWTARENSRIQKLTKEANLRLSGACFADVDYRPSRKLDRAYMARLSDFSWVKDARNLILTGCTGTGKTWLACAFGSEACRKGLRVTFYRVNHLLAEMAAANAAGSAGKLLVRLKKQDILILDDWALGTINPLEGRFLLEVFEERYREHSAIISAQLPVAQWHGIFEDSTVADAILDRIVHNAYRLTLCGPSLRASMPDDSGMGAPHGGDEVQNTGARGAKPSADSQEDGDYHAVQ